MTIVTKYAAVAHAWIIAGMIIMGLGVDTRSWVIGIMCFSVAVIHALAAIVHLLKGKNAPTAISVVGDQSG